MGSHLKPCECCGTTAGVREVEVRNRKTGEPHVLTLCKRCRERPRAWHLTWAVDPEDR